MYKIFFLVIFSLIFRINTFADKIDSLKVLLSTTNTERKAKIYNDIANEYIGFDNQKASIYADSALFLGEKTNNYLIIANAYTNKANSFYYLGDFDSSLIFYELSYEKIKKTNNKLEIASSLNRLGLIHEAKSEYKTASEYFFKALEIFEQIKHLKGIADVYNNLGIINNVTGDDKISIDFYKKSLKIYSEINNQLGQAKVLNNIATVYNENNQLDTALIYMKKALQIFKNANNKSEIATALNNIGNIFVEKENFDSAQYYVEYALKIDMGIGNKHGIANGYNDIAKIELKKKNFQTALNYLHKALKIRQEVKNKLAEANTLSDISSVYQEIEKYDSSLFYYIRFTELKDSVFGEEIHLKISELQLKYTTEKKDKEIQLLKKDAQISTNLKILLFIIIIALFIISILALYLLKTKSKLLSKNKTLFEQQEEINHLATEKHETKRKLLEEEILKQQELNQLQEEKHNAELQHKNRELITSTMHLLNKNKILSEIQTYLEKIHKNSTLETKRVIKQINKEIKSNTNLDSDWEQFKKHFEDVNINFFNNLQNKYPDLTKGDLKVCAYLKINLSSKEIAQMLNISLNGVNKKLYRLRKKLNISSGTSLTIFLMDF